MKLACMAVMALLPVLGCSAAGPSAELVDLRGSMQGLRDGFNAEADRPRLVALLSPH